MSTTECRAGRCNHYARTNEPRTLTQHLEFGHTSEDGETDWAETTHTILVSPGHAEHIRALRTSEAEFIAQDGDLVDLPRPPIHARLGRLCGAYPMGGDELMYGLMTDTPPCRCPGALL